MIKKRILNPERIRGMDGGFAFIPHCFLTDGFLSVLNPSQQQLYFFLVLAADRHRLSFYKIKEIKGTGKLNLTDLLFWCNQIERNQKPKRCGKGGKRMPRTSRMIIAGEEAIYHVMSRTALDGFPLQDVEKDFLLDLIKRFSSLYFVEILGFCLMGNHFHLLLKMIPDDRFTDEEIKKRFEAHFGDERDFAEGQIPYLREKLSSLSEFMREIKVGFARYYNRRHNRRGYFWGDRFKSVIVDKGETLVNCLAYIDLNPLRAGLVERPEDYRWNSLGYHLQTENKDQFLSTDFGLKEFNVKSEKERIRRYRRYVYEAGAISRPDKMQAKVIDNKVVAKERKKDFEISRISRFRHRTRYFTDSGIIGSKEFVAENYRRFKHLFHSKHEKKPKPIKGLDGMYSLKRLSELI